MTNHVHLAMRAGAVPLSRVMAGLQSSYTQWFNRRHARVGHLFQGRYKAFLVQEDRYLLALIRYIHLNPVAAGVVDHVSKYAWSSDRYYRDGSGPPWLDIDVALPTLASSRRLAVHRYIELVIRAMPCRLRRPTDFPNIHATPRPSIPPGRLGI